MRRYILSLAFAGAASVALTGCATNRHSVTLGNYKVVYGEMSPAAQRWEHIKAALAGWESVAATDEEEGSVLLLRKRR